MNNKNKIFADYINNEINESQLIFLLDDLQAKSIKTDGVIYTPWEIVEYMISLAKPTPNMNIIEPSCGHGAFILGLLNYMNSQHKISHNELLTWFIQKVTCVDISINTLLEFKEILVAYFKKHYQIEVDTSSFSNIICSDALIEFSQLPSSNNQYSFDLCIGNPPYIRAKNLSPDYLKFLKENFSSCKTGTIDIYFAFIEKFSNLSSQLVFITPNSFITSNAGKILKNMIFPKLHTLIDFKEKKVFQDANVYTCIFKTISLSSDFLVYGNNTNSVSLIEKSNLLTSTLTQGPFEEVLSGIATLCHQCYLVEKDSHNHFWATFQGNTYPIEKEMVAPYLKITKIKDQDLSHINYMIYPYDNNNHIIKEDYLKNTYPLTYNYLLAIKQQLSTRDKGKTSKYESWYAYGRKQGLHHITSPNIILIPQMIGGECLPIKININSLLEQYSHIVFTSGYVIPINDDKKPYNTLLGNDFINFSKKYGKPWPGKNEAYYSLTSKQIKQFQL